MVSESAELVVRRALYDRLPARAFTVSDGRDLVAVGSNWIDFDELCQGIVGDLIEADYVARVQP